MERNLALNQYFEQLSSIATESFYVIDVLLRRFNHWRGGEFMHTLQRRIGI